MVDCPDKEIPFTAKVIQDVFDELPGMLSRCFKIDYNIPMAAELEVGPNWLDMIPYTTKGN
jgi:hypothetical protein